MFPGKESPYQRDIRTLLNAAQSIELGESLDTDVIILAQRSSADDGILGVAAHLVLYGERGRDARANGHIWAAQAWEEARDTYYQKLPEKLRW